MQHLDVSSAVRHIYIYVIRRLKVKTTGVYAVTVLMRTLQRRLNGCCNDCKIITIIAIIRCSMFCLPF